MLVFYQDHFGVCQVATLGSEHTQIVTMTVRRGIHNALTTLQEYASCLRVSSQLSFYSISYILYIYIYMYVFLFILIHRWHLGFMLSFTFSLKVRREPKILYNEDSNIGGSISEKKKPPEERPTGSHHPTLPGIGHERPSTHASEPSPPRDSHGLHRPAPTLEGKFPLDPRRAHARLLT